MQSKISFFHKTIFRKNITYFWPVWVLYSLICIWKLPVNTYFRIHSIGSRLITEADQSYDKMISAMGSIQDSANTWIVFLFAIISAVVVFSYLYTEKNANMIHALPVRREELFVTNYLSGLMFLIVPQAAAFLITVFLWFGNGITQLEYLLQWLGMMSGESFFAYNLGVFCVMLTGHAVAAPICFFLLNYLYIGIFNLISMVLKMTVYGYAGKPRMSAGEWLAPIYFFTQNTGMRYPDVGDTQQPWMEGLGYVACYIPAALVLWGLALMLYRRRRLECAGDFIAVSWMKPLVRWGGSLLGAGTFTAFIMNSFFIDKRLSGEALPILLLLWGIGGVLVFYGIEMLIEKKFMVFQKKRILESGLFFAVILLFLLGADKDILGLEKRTPDIDDIAAVYMQGSYDRYLTGTEKIEESIKLQKEIVAVQEEYQNYFKKYLDKGNCPYMTLDLTYILKNGMQQKRSYALPLDEYYLETTGSPVKRLMELEADPEGYMSYYFTNQYANIKILNGSTIDYVDENYNFQSRDISTQAAKKLVEALKQDIASGAYRIYPYDMKEREENTYVNTMMICYMPVKGAHILQYGQGIDSISDGKYSEYASVILTKDCKNTITLLKELGYVDEKNGLVTQREYNGAVDYK